MKYLYLASVFTFIVSVPTAYSQSGTDLTLIAGSSGVDVVDACIQKLRGISLFQNDFGFLKRIALVESNFGQDTTATNSNPTGGIWQITPSMYNTLVNSLDQLSALLNQSSSVLGSEVADLSSNDFSIPLRSALAARLYIELQLQQNSFPGSVADQGEWWSLSFTTSGQSSSIFINRVETYEETNQCKVSKLDLWFLIDGSGSIGASNFETCLDFVKNTAASFNISANQVRTGLMVYDDRQTIISYFNQHESNEEFSNAVLTTTYPSGGTRTGEAISAVMNEGFNVSTGARPLAEGVPRILIVLTDGKSGDNVIGPSQAIKDASVTVFGVGVGKGFDESEIREIASDPDSEYAFEFSEFGSLVSVLKDRVATQACTVPAVVQDNTAISISLEARSTFYSRILLPSNGSVELVYEMELTASIGIVYVSDSVTNPNSAVFDVSFQVAVGVTSYFINAPDAGASPELVRRRKKRDAEVEMIPLYIAFVVDGPEPVNLNFRAQSSEVRATSASTTTTATTTTTTTTSGAEKNFRCLLHFTVITCFLLLAYMLLF